MLNISKVPLRSYIVCLELTFLLKCAEIWLLLYGLCFLACCLWYLGRWELPQGSQWMCLLEGTMFLHGLLTTLSTSMEAQRYSSSWINTRVYYNQINHFFLLSIVHCISTQLPGFLFLVFLHQNIVYRANIRGFDIAKVLVSNQKGHTYLAISVCKWSWFLVIQLEQLLLSM